MTILRTFATSLLLAMSSWTMADDYQYLTVAEGDAETSFTVSSIQKITFDATNMILHMKDGTTQNLPLSDLHKMFFTESATDIATLGNTKSKIQFAGGMLRADMAPGEKLTVYSMKGEQVFSANKSGSYDLSSLVKGVYIIRVGNVTKKVVNK